MQLKKYKGKYYYDDVPNDVIISMEDGTIDIDQKVSPVHEEIEIVDVTEEEFGKLMGF